MKQSQNAQILKWLKSGKTLTALQALEKFGCWRLAARIDDLRVQLGQTHNDFPWQRDKHIKTNMSTLKSGKRIAVYRLM